MKGIDEENRYFLQCAFTYINKHTKTHTHARARTSLMINRNTSSTFNSLAGKGKTDGIPCHSLSSYVGPAPLNTSEAIPLTELKVDTQDPCGYECFEWRLYWEQALYPLWHETRTEHVALCWERHRLDGNMQIRSHQSQMLDGLKEWDFCWGISSQAAGSIHRISGVGLASLRKVSQDI